VTTYTFPDEAHIPWRRMSQLGPDGESVLFYGRTGAGMTQRPWRGEGVWQGGKPVIANAPEALTLTHWLQKPNYEVSK